MIKMVTVLDWSERESIGYVEWHRYVGIFLLWQEPLGWASKVSCKLASYICSHSLFNSKNNRSKAETAAYLGIIKETKTQKLIVFSLSVKWQNCWWSIKTDNRLTQAEERLASQEEILSWERLRWLFRKLKKKQKSLSVFFFKYCTRLMELNSFWSFYGWLPTTFREEERSPPWERSENVMRLMAGIKSAACVCLHPKSSECISGPHKEIKVGHLGSQDRMTKYYWAIIKTSFTIRLPFKPN